MSMKRPVFTLFVAAMAVGIFPNAYAAKDHFADLSPKQLFEQVCATCHNLDLPKSQRLDRAGWEWVVSDMKDFGLTFVPDKHLERIIDYLAENYGPDDPR